MKIVADKMGINIYEVIDAAVAKLFGFTSYYPGLSLGEHCMPIDPFYFTWKAREYGLNTHFIELAGEVNTSMPKCVIGKLADALNRKCESIKSGKVLVLGIAYKSNVDDMRESPSVKLMELLGEKGAIVNYSDPHIAVFPKIREHYFDSSSIELTLENIKKFDCVPIATNHKVFDYEMIKSHVQLIVDKRGVYEESFDELVRA